MKNKLFAQFIARPSNIYPSYWGVGGELIPCVISDEAGNYVSQMDIPAIIWESLPDAE